MKLAMSTKVKPEPGDAGSLLHAKGMNASAQAATLSYLDTSQSFGAFDKWTEVKCEDGTKARILKNPEDAFELYAKEWSNKLNVVVDLLNQAKVQGSDDLNSKIVKLFDNLGNVEATLREMYKNAYLTFAATPCKEKAQEEKRAMDRIIVAASLSLLSFKTMIENKGVQGVSATTGSTNVDSIYNETLKLIDKITSMIIR
jgi:hypothetical protein